MDRKRKYYGENYVSPGEKNEGASLATELTKMIEDMSRDYGVPPHMAASLNLNRVRLFTIGIDQLDAEIRSEAKDRLSEFLTGLRQHYLLLNNPVFKSPDPVQWRQNKENFENVDEVVEGWEKDEQAGLSIEPIFEIVEESMRMRYLPDSLKGRELSLSPEEAKDKLGELADLKDAYEIAKVLHQDGKITGLPSAEERQTISDEEFEKARSEFEKRSEQSYYLAQLTASRLFVEYLYAFYMTGKPGSTMSLALFKEYKDKLFDEDPRSKAAMLRHFSAVLRIQAASESIEIVKNYFEHISRLMTSIGDELTSFVDALIEMHVKHTIALPDYLLAYEEKTAQSESSEVLKTPEVETSAEPSEEEKLAALEGRIEALREKINLAFEEIVLSKNVRMSAGFAPFKEALGRGLKVDDVPGRLERVEPDYAKQLFDMLVFLRQVSSNEDLELRERQQTLQTFSVLAEELKHELRELKTFGAEQNLTRLKHIEWPTVFPFTERLEAIKQQWPHIEWLIINKWSDNGEAEAEKLRKLLFAVLPEEPLEDGRATPRRLSEQEARSFVDAHLNEVLFPRGRTVTEAEVREVAQRAGFTRRQMEDLEWERVRDLAMLRDITGGTLYDAKADEKFLGNEVPYFIVLFEFDGETYAVAESPIKESATYVVKGNSWSEILKAPRRIDARRLGAVYVIHSTKSPYGDAHIEKITDKVLELHEKDNNN